MLVDPAHPEDAARAVFPEPRIRIGSPAQCDRILRQLAISILVLVAAGCANSLPVPESPIIHPAVFPMVMRWISETESPVVSEVNLDAMLRDRNQFSFEEVSTDGEWFRLDCDHGFEQYRVLSRRGHAVPVEYESNGGGSMATVKLTWFELLSRRIEIDVIPQERRVMRIIGVDRQPAREFGPRFAALELTAALAVGSVDRALAVDGSSARLRSPGQ